MAEQAKSNKQLDKTTRAGGRRKHGTAAAKEDEDTETEAAPKPTQLDVADIAGAASRAGNVAVAPDAKQKLTRSARKRRKKKPTKAVESQGETAVIAAEPHPPKTVTTPIADRAGEEQKAAPRKGRHSRRGRGSRSSETAPVRPNATAHDTTTAHHATTAHHTAVIVREDAPKAVAASSDSYQVPAAQNPEPHKSQRRRGKRSKKSRAEARVDSKVGTERADQGSDPSKRGRVADVAPTTGGRELVINVAAGDECRIAVLNDGRLEELFLERSSTQSHVGNIYKGRVTNVESSIQAVFVDFGLPKNGFLHISDVQPQYFPHHSGEAEDVGRKIPRHNRPPIQKCFRRGQEVIVQVTKEGVGTKGPTLTTYLSIPGRFIVMMPGMSKHGVSRKIEDDADRRQMRDMLGQIKLPAGMGFIMRTAGLGRTKRDLQRDLNYLLRLWKTVVARIKEQPAPAELYKESDLVTRTIRDVYTTEFTRIIVDDAETATKVREFLRLALPRSTPVVDMYTEREPIFHRLGIEKEIDCISMREVPLPSGGSIVIDSTEAMVAIDVNSGKFRSPDDAEETAYRINLEAATEIARQLRLRDLGGLIVCDFIDMRDDRHKRDIERVLRDGLKSHKERARILRMSAFGLIEMTRQRQGPSLNRNIYEDCPTCRGTGQIKLPESVRLDVMRMIQLAIHKENVTRVVVRVSSPVAIDILNQKRAKLSQMESETQKAIVIRGEPGFVDDRVECVCEDAMGRTFLLGGNGARDAGGSIRLPQ